MICLKCQKVKKFRENGMTNRQSVYNKTTTVAIPAGIAHYFAE